MSDSDQPRNEELLQALRSGELDAAGEEELLRRLRIPSDSLEPEHAEPKHYFHADSLRGLRGFNEYCPRLALLMVENPEHYLLRRVDEKVVTGDASFETNLEVKVLCRSYYNALSRVIAAYDSHDPVTLVDALCELRRRLGPELYRDFLASDGLFADTGFFRNCFWDPYPGLIASREILQEDAVQVGELDPLYPEGKRPRDAFMDFYGPVLTFDTSIMPGLGFVNPFNRTITTWRDKDWGEVAEQARECFRNLHFRNVLSSALEPAPAVSAFTNNPRVVKWSPETHTPYLSLRKHAKLCGASPTIFQNSERWGALTQTGLKRKHGQYDEYAFLWEELLQLAQNQSLLRGGPAIKDESDLRRKYRVL